MEPRRTATTSGRPAAAERPAAGTSTYPRRFGALPEASGVRFRVFAPTIRDLRLHVVSGRGAGVHRPVTSAGGMCEFFVPGAAAGDRYGYTLDGSDIRPDPASRHQPDGVHGPSEVVDPGTYRWEHAEWRSHDPRQLVVYELHVGTFTQAGTFAAAREKLPELKALGVTAIEIMPVADFAGTRNWGYDGVCLFAPARVYGRPDDFRSLVDAAHGLGLSVLLDVVYNHLGPEGAYIPQFHTGYITDRHSTPWGGAVNLDGPDSELVRGFIIDNAEHWVREYRLDGLRLDATHALIDTSPTHLVAELVDSVRAAVPWRVHVHGEDHRNLNSLVEGRERGGWGLDGVWADDFHHVVRRQLAGDRHGYYEDFEGSCEELARTIQQGWLFVGQHSRHADHLRGTDASAIPMERFVVCLQNHDQVGNRAFGERLHHQVEGAAWRAASTVLLTVPMTPLLFMGQEWAASTPFLYFTDLEPELGKLVTEGRRREFQQFPEFSDASTRERIPDPQAASTLEASRLNWEERAGGVHAATLALYRRLLALRQAHPALAADDDLQGDAVAFDRDTIEIRREKGGEAFAILIRLSGSGPVVDDGVPFERAPEVVFSTEDPQFCSDPMPPRIDVRRGAVAVEFQRPGAVILKR